MTEAEWLASTDPAAMLKWIVETGGELSNRPRNPPSGRKLRLFACACVILESGRKDRADRYERRGMPGYSDWEWANAWLSLSETITQVQKANLIRDIVGNPWRLFRRFGDAVCDQKMKELFELSPTISRIANTIYDERRFDDLPILADALEDAGCTNEEILRHCRNAITDKWSTAVGPHVRGCWVIDLILGKD